MNQPGEEDKPFPPGVAYPAVQAPPMHQPPVVYGTQQMQTNNVCTHVAISSINKLSYSLDYGCDGATSPTRCVDSSASTSSQTNTAGCKHCVVNHYHFSGHLAQLVLPLPKCHLCHSGKCKI